jgi:cyclase
MKRSVFLAALVGAGALSLTVAAYQQPPQPQALEVQKVRDNLYALVGGGGNTGVFIGTNGVVVIDTKNPGYGTPILNKIKELTPKPVTMIINTHTHGDHVSGNVEFPATVDVVTQENTAANMKRMAPVTGLSQPGAPPPPNIFEQNGGRNLAKRTFKDRMTIGNGAERIELYYFGRAHTNGDAWVVFPALRVAHVGDTFAGKTPPIMDANNGGSGIEYAATLAKGYAGIKDVDTIINGHMPATTTWPELKEYEEFIRDFVSYAQAQMKAGKSVDDATAGYKVPERFRGYTAAPARVKSDIQVIYDELKKK